MDQQELLQAILTELRAFKADVNKRFEEVDRRFDKLEAQTDRRFEEVNSRLDRFEAQTDRRFEEVNSRFDRLEAQTNERFEEVDKRFDELNEKIDRNDAGTRDAIMSVVDAVGESERKILGKIDEIENVTARNCYRLEVLDGRRKQG